MRGTSYSKCSTGPPTSTSTAPTLRSGTYVQVGGVCGYRWEGCVDTGGRGVWMQVGGVCGYRWEGCVDAGGRGVWIQVGGQWGRGVWIQVGGAVGEGCVDTGGRGSGGGGCGYMWEWQ